MVYLSSRQGLADLGIYNLVYLNSKKLLLSSLYLILKLSSIQAIYSSKLQTNRPE
jgi:hypothetical protein